MSASYKFNREQVLVAARRGARNAVNAITLEVQNQIASNLNQHASNRSSGHGASAPGEPPGKSTGTLARSWQAQAVKDVSKLNDPVRPAMSLGSNLVYARIHEYGGTINGKPWLTIPISTDAKRASAQGVGPRAFGNTFFRKIAGGLGIFRARKRGTSELMYVLKHSVTLPPRPYLRPALATVRPKAGAIVDKFMDAALGRFKRA